MAEPTTTIISTFTSSWSSLGAIAIPIAIILGLAIVGVIVWFIGSIKKSRGAWNITFRIRMEDKETNKIYLDPIVIKAKRVMVKDVRLLYLEKPVLGKHLFPLLNYHTKPNVYDLLITADNRIFLVTGITGIDKTRGELQVGLRYPGIDHSLDEINRDYAKLNQAERKNDLLAMLKAGATAVIAICILIAVIVGGKYYIEGKEIDQSISASEQLLFEQITTTMQRQEEQTNAMIILTDKLKELTGSNNLRGQITGG